MAAKAEYRNVRHGICTVPARLMGWAEGYVMVRRQGCMPFIASRRDWDAAPLCDVAGNPLNRSNPNG